MQPFRTVLNTINNNESYRRFTKNSLLMNWGWLASFFMISIFNGWVINLSPVKTRFLSIEPTLLKQTIVIYFAIFPLASIVYIFLKSTKILVFSIIASQSILAIALCYIKLPNFSPLLVVFLGFNLLLFVFLLFFVCKTRGFVAPAFILCFVTILIITGFGRLAFHLVWYCNLILTVNKAGRQLRYALNSFDAAILSLTGIAAIGLAVGWLMGGVVKG
ncbi:hypothetical protein IQ247_24195 [Plectonema cf. radiosum LEGE 06105]|uniref:Uncharacterized protein n=1 Tax=Plectonema cf. radiosum LEGE 06105 TaxID=945769 RepID=A0A8J7JVF1_9CYAN|nr:hypothetical protein [Plectonema radiosum]MBE9215729.1 hypothetical protein [Plectonema cf. radiosum LEGE 06105]